MTTPHIASPDVIVDDARKRFVMAYHGLESFGTQLSRIAISTDGIHFTGRPQLLARPYLRLFDYHGQSYGLAMPGHFYRATNADLTAFEAGPVGFNRKMRHNAVLVHGDELFVFWTQVGDTPERILMSRIDLTQPFSEWSDADPVEVLRPERAWEGADEPLEASQRSTAYGRVNQLRDPAIFVEDGRVFLLYAVAGESGIALAELNFAAPPPP